MGRRGKPVTAGTGFVVHCAVTTALLVGMMYVVLAAPASANDPPAERRRLTSLGREHKRRVLAIRRAAVIAS